MEAVSDTSPTPDPATNKGTRSGTTFVIATGVFLVVFLVLILVVSPRLQDRLGLRPGAQPFETPGESVQVELTLEGRAVGTATWDAEGVCAEVTDETGTTFRTCATPDSLRPIWAIDAPDDADPAYVIVASPPEVSRIVGVTTDGEGLDGLTQSRELPAAWTLIRLQPGAAVRELVAFNTEDADLGNAECGVEDAPSDGPDRLSGGCIVERQD